jgi:hypothetical protein
MHDSRVVAAVMAGKTNVEVAAVMREVSREYARSARNGEEDISGPPRPSHWLMPSARAREEMVQLGQSLVPHDRLRPTGSAVTVTPLPAGDQAPAQCASGHELHPEATACGICGAGAADESPDPGIMPSRYPAGQGIFGGIGGR